MAQDIAINLDSTLVLIAPYRESAQMLLCKKGSSMMVEIKVYFYMTQGLTHSFDVDNYPHCRNKANAVSKRNMELQDYKQKYYPIGIK